MEQILRANNPQTEELKRHDAWFAAELIDATMFPPKFLVPQLRAKNGVGQKAGY